MIIAVGCDHAGFTLKAHVVELIRSLNHDIVDCGATTLVPSDDYPDYALAVAEAVRSGRAERGIVVCGSGVGVSVAANKVPGIRAAMCHDTFSARQGVEDDSMNVLCLGGASSAQNWRAMSFKPICLPSSRDSSGTSAGSIKCCK